MARTRSIPRNVMTRAWNIARNAMNHHNSTAERVAESGGATTVLEFFSEALRLAWREIKTNRKLYQNVQGLPRKVMPRIHAALKRAYRANPNLSMFEATMVALRARYGSEDKIPEGTMERLFQTQLAL